MTDETPTPDDRDEITDVSRRSVLRSVGVGAGASIVGGLASSTGVGGAAAAESSAELSSSRTRTLARTALASRRVTALATAFESGGFDAADERARAYRVETDDRRLAERDPVMTVIPFEPTRARSDEGIGLAYALLADSRTGYDVEGLLGLTVERDRRPTIHGGRDVVVSLWGADGEVTTIADRRVSTSELAATTDPDWCEICEEAMTAVCDVVGDGEEICSIVCPGAPCTTICSIILGFITDLACGDDPTSLCEEFGVCDGRGR
ncbi:hypothetical protein [Halovivax limisalsi]|uniref:hypothetical protein n=1 Tax=Halovivax limisalsi TaxID=1453760 RepID=UPI001FFC3CD3|nr:hypothetical protein [Halovivax limisalsi]